MIPKEIFHYTKTSTALEKILFERKMKIGQLALMNDPYESKAFILDSFISVSDADDVDLYNRLSDVAKRIKLNEWKALCFSKSHCDLESNKKSKHDYPLLRGVFRPTMWAHYAENHKGVCFTFYGERLDKQIREFFQKLDTKCRVFDEGDVLYRDFDVHDSNPDVNIDEVIRLDDIKLEEWFREYFRNNYQEIFLKKTKGWEAENEYRWIVHSEDSSSEIFIPIGDALKEITVGCDFHKAYEPSLFKFCEDLNIPAYRMNWLNGIPSRFPIFPLKQ